GHPRAENDASHDVATELVSAEPVLGGRRGKAPRKILVERRLPQRQPRCKDRHQDQQRDDDQPGQRGGIAHDGAQAAVDVAEDGLAPRQRGLANQPLSEGFGGHCALSRGSKSLYRKSQIRLMPMNTLPTRTVPPMTAFMSLLNSACVM